MTAHYFIATLKPILVYHTSENNYAFLNGEAYKESLPFTLPYVYELGDEDIEFITFLDSFMEIGDVVELYIFEEGRLGYPLSHNYPEESRTINLLKKQDNVPATETENSNEMLVKWIPIITEVLRSLKPKLLVLRCQVREIHGSINIWMIEMVMA